MLFGVDNLHTGMAQTPPPISPRIEWREHIQDLPYYPDPTPVFTYETNALEPQAIPSDLALWSRITFQSYRDGNWEIYFADGGGGNQQRLTADPAADIHPRLNRGCTHVVFASRRTGNYEIFSMRLSDLKQLTFTSSDNVYPVWSPDGTKIAFQAYRDGQAEVYVMNADGSGQTRLTVNTAYDGEPAWSPDGNKIAFVSTRAGASNIWVMNSDGSDVRQLSTQPYSENPAWSPDGSQIAFDADGNEDGWQEIWLMHAYGMDQRQVYKPPENQTDAWVGGWSPFAGYLAFTRISLINYQGNWYWTLAYVDAWDSTTGGVTRLNNQATEWNPDWQSFDITPPTASIEPLAAYSRNGVTVRWTGEDYYSTALKYDMQYRESEAGEWVDWEIGTAATSADFQGMAGHAYTFRVRATDEARNTGAWSQDDEASTTLYTWAINGTIRDNRGIPQSKGMIATAPVAFANFPSDEQGKYAAYVAEEAEVYQGMWSKFGYGELPATILSSPQDAQYDVILPPANNAVQDWGFESGNFETGGWIANGVTTPSLASKAVHSGQFGVLFGQTILSQNISQTDNDADMPAIGVDESGLLHIAWVDISTTRRIAYTNCTQDGVCQSVEIPFLGEMPALAVGTNGQVHLVWVQNDTQIMYAKRSSAGVWSIPKQLGTATDWMAGLPKIALDPYDLPHVVWSHERVIYYSQKNSDGIWTTPEVLAEGTLPDIAISNTGDIHVVWAAPYSWEWMGHRTRHINSSWNDTYNFDQTYYVMPPAIALDSYGNAYIVWLHDYLEQIKYLRRDVSGSWTTPSSVGSSLGMDPKVVCMPDDHIVVSWTAGGQWITYRTTDSEWTPPRAILSFEAGVGYTAMVAHPNSNKISIVAGGRSKVDYYNTHTNIFATTFGVPLEKAGHNAIKQVVNVPADMLEPTLSFLYQHTVEDTSSADRFTVYLEGSNAITQSYTLGPATEWTHNWFDVKNWSGESLTITFDLFTADDNFLSWAYLDEVTLGSSFPDLWVRDCAMNALPGEHAVCTLTYGNQGGATAKDGQIIVSLPQNVLFEAATPAPRFDSLLLHWIWDLGDIPAQSRSLPIVITTTIAPTATAFSTYTGTLTLDSATPEIETDNNTATLVAFVGRRVYLPLTLRNK